MTLRQRVQARKQLLPAKRPKWSLRQHVVHSAIDNRRWNTWIRPDFMVDKWVESLFEGNEDRPQYYNAPQLLEDVSYVLFKTNPIYYDQASVKPDAWINRSLLDLVYESGVFDQLREHTERDLDATAQGVSAVADVIAQILEQIQDAVNAANEAKEAAENGEGVDSDAMQELADEVKEQISQYQSRMDKAMRDIARSLDQQQSNAKNFGSESAELGKTDPETRQQRRNFLKDNKINDLASRVGRMKRLITGNHTRATDNHGYDPVGIEMGDNLGNVLDSEWMLTWDEEQDHPGLYDFLNRYVDSRLQQHETKEVIDSGMGDVVCCVDCSGSMGDGDKLTWAIAVAESVRQIATKQGRDVKIIVFNASVRAEHSFQYNANFDSVMEWLSTDCSGGTDLAVPLDRAVELIKSDERSTADILMITDGQWSFNQNWVENFNSRRKEIGIRTHIVHVDPGDNSSLEQLQCVGDNIVGLDSLTDQSGSEVMSQVLKM